MIINIYITLIVVLINTPEHNMPQKDNEVKTEFQRNINIDEYLENPSYGNLNNVLNFLESSTEDEFYDKRYMLISYFKYLGSPGIEKIEEIILHGSDKVKKKAYMVYSNVAALLDVEDQVRFRLSLFENTDTYIRSHNAIALGSYIAGKGKNSNYIAVVNELLENNDDIDIACWIISSILIANRETAKYIRIEENINRIIDSININNLENSLPQIFLLNKLFKNEKMEQFVKKHLKDYLEKEVSEINDEAYIIKKWCLNEICNCTYNREKNEFERK